MSWLPTLLPPDSVPSGLVRESQLLHHVSAEELDPTLSPRSRRNVLYQPTGVRAGSGWSVASNGRVYRTPEDVPRFEWFDLDNDGILETASLCCDDTESNLCQHSDVLTSWTVNSTIAATIGSAVGEVQMHLVSDTDAVNAAFLSKTLGTFTGSTVKGIMVLWGKGPSPAASGAWIRLRNTTGSADVLNATITVNADNSPSVAIVGGAGTFLGSRYLCTIGGVAYYALLFTCSAISTANAHEARLGAAVTGTQTGSVYWGGVTITDELRVSSLIDRPSTGTVTRAREVIGWLAPFVTVAAQSWQIECLEVGAAATTGSILAALTDAAGANPSLSVSVNASGRYTVTHHNGTSSVLSAATVTPVYPNRVRLLVSYFDDGSVQIGQAIDSGAMVFGTRSAALAPATAWGVTPATTGFFLQPTAGFSKAKTRLLRWKVSGGILTDTQLMNRW